MHGSESLSRVGDAIAYVGVICVICGMIANPRGDK